MHTLRGSEEKRLITAVMDVWVRTGVSFTPQDLLTPQNASLVEKLRSFSFSIPIGLTPPLNLAIPPHALHRAERAHVGGRQSGGKTERRRGEG